MTCTCFRCSAYTSTLALLSSTQLPVDPNLRCHVCMTHIACCICLQHALQKCNTAQIEGQSSNRLSQVQRLCLNGSRTTSCVFASCTCMSKAIYWAHDHLYVRLTNYVLLRTSLPGIQRKLTLHAQAPMHASPHRHTGSQLPAACGSR